MWVCKLNGEIIGGSPNPQMVDCVPSLGDWANGKLENPQDLRLLPGPNDELLEQVWIPDEQYRAWKSARPVKPVRNLAAEVDELRAKLAALEPKPTEGARR